MDTPERPIRLGLIHPMRTWLQALAVVLSPLPDIDVVIGHPDPRWVRHAVSRGEVDVVVIRLAAGEGAAEVDELRQASPDIAVVVIGDSDDPDVVASLVRAGARGYLSENCSLEELHAAIRTVAHGDTWMTPSHMSLLIEGLLASRSARPMDDRLSVLSARELEILECLSLGMRRDEIAERLFISPNTVRTHINHLIKKLGAHSALAAVSIMKGSDRPHGSPGHAGDGRSLPKPRQALTQDQLISGLPPGP